LSANNISLFTHNLPRFRSQTCKPNPLSMLGILERKKDLKTLIVVLDGYPSASLYKILTGAPSRLHSTLYSISDIAYGEYRNSIAYTPLSLSNILSRVDPIGSSASNCIYPFPNLYPPPVQLLANNHFYHSSSACYNLYRDFRRVVQMKVLYFYLGTLRERLPFLASYLNKYIPQSYSLRPKSICSLASHDDISKRIIDRIQLASANRDYRVFFVHEMMFHDEASEGLYTKSKLLDLDSRYSTGITDLIHKVRSHTGVNLLVVLSDHGPRSGTFNKTSFGRLNSLSDKDMFGYFAYLYPFNNVAKDSLLELKTSLPDHSNVRYVYRFDLGIVEKYGASSKSKN
jgi:hypothetical protein